MIYFGRNPKKSIGPNHQRAARGAFLELEMMPKRISFHNSDYAMNILTAIEELSSFEDIPLDGMNLLRTVAFYGNLGYLYSYSKHEQSAIEKVRKDLPSYNYNNQEIDLVCGMIEAAEIPQNPQKTLQEILCDATLCYLGKKNFFDAIELLKKEKINHGIKLNEEKFYANCFEFLKNHTYFRKSAKRLWNEGKLQNIAEMEEKFGFPENL